MSELARLELGGDAAVPVAAISGEIDISNAASIGARLAEGISNSAAGLTLDARELDYLDSAGIRMLFDLDERLARRGQRLALVIAPGANVLRVLDATGVTTTMIVASTPEQARERLLAPPSP